MYILVEIAICKCGFVGMLSVVVVFMHSGLAGGTYARVVSE